MPDRSNIEHFVTRLVRDPTALFVDDYLARAFNRLPMPTRRAIMGRVEALRAQARAATTREVVARWADARRGDTVRAVRPEEQALDRVNRPVRPPSFVTLNLDDVVAERRAVDPAENRTRVVDEITELTRSDEENARLDLIAQMRRDMAREIDEYRTDLLDRYAQLPAQRHTRPEFQAWSRNIETGVAGIRARWERLIEREERQGQHRPPPPVVAWPDPADYGPNGRYATQRGALSAFTRAVITTAAVMADTVARDEARDRVHINGTRDIRRAWNLVPIQQAARLTRTGEPVRWTPGLPPPPHWTTGTSPATDYAVTVPPPPTTQPWRDETAPEVDETDVMIKHLPRSGKCVVIVGSRNDAMEVRQKMDESNISHVESYVLRVANVGRDSVLRTSILHFGRPVFIDPAVFKMHAARQGDWSDADLDAVIELQGQIPDEEPT